MSKSTTKSASRKSKTVQSASEAFGKAVHAVLVAKCRNGSALPAPKIARALLREGRTQITNFQLLKMLVNQAVTEGVVPDAANITGRAGGIFLVSQRDAWNKAVEAEAKAA